MTRKELLVGFALATSGLVAVGSCGSAGGPRGGRYVLVSSQYTLARMDTETGKTVLWTVGSDSTRWREVEEPRPRN